MISIDLKTKKLEMRGSEPDLYVEVAEICNEFCKIVTANHPKQPDFADNLMKSMLKANKMGDEEVEAEIERARKENPDTMRLAEILTDMQFGR